VEEWHFVEALPEEELARLDEFTIKKKQNGKDIEFRITVREYLHPPQPGMKFFACADRQTNQKTAPFTACGWGTTLLKALSECVSELRRFAYQGEEV
jgi:hypothetical protein